MKTVLRTAGLFATFLIPLSLSFPQSAGDYRSHASGNWSDVSTWDRFDGLSWVNPAPGVPAGGEVVTIQSPDSVTVDIPLSVTGTVRNAGRIGGWQNLSFASGGTYMHQQNAGAIPICTWNAGSTCMVTSVIDTAPAWTNQNFYNLTWDCPNQSANLNLGWHVGPIVLGGTLRVLNTNWSRASTTSPTPQLRLFGGSGTCTINGDVIVSGRYAALATMGSSYADTVVVNGNITVSSNGVLSLSNNSGGVSQWYLKGNLSFPDTATFSKSSNGNLSTVIFAGSSPQSFVAPAAGSYTFAGAPNFQVNGGSTLALGADKDVLSGSGSFRLQPGATFVTGNSGGINGAVKCSGSYGGGNLFSSGANYAFVGNVAQVTGTKLPSTINNLTINNPAGVTLSVIDTVTQTLFLNGGTFALGDHNLSAGAVSGGSSSAYVLTAGHGLLTIRSVGAGPRLFPVGTSVGYSPVFLSNTGAVDDFAVQVKNTFDHAPSTSAVVNCQWTITEKGTGADAAITLGWTAANEAAGFDRGMPLAIGCYSGSAWQNQNATFGDSGGGLYTAFASGFTSCTMFDVSNTGALPVQIASFGATPDACGRIRVEWGTLSEVNNYGFVVERSSSPGAGFGAISPWIPGHGTTLVPQQYAFTDSTPDPGATYYRLRHIDLDNTVHYTAAIRAEAGAPARDATPGAFALFQNHPNPFNPTTTIRYALPVRGYVTMTVYNAIGQKVADLVRGEVDAGYHDVRFDASRFSSGVYFCRMLVQSGTGSYADTKKLMFEK